MPVLEAIGAAVNFTPYSNLVGGAQGTIVGGTFGDTGDDGREIGTIEDLRFLLSRNISVTLYAGDADYKCVCVYYKIYSYCTDKQASVAIGLVYKLSLNSWHLLAFQRLVSPTSLHRME